MNGSVGGATRTHGTETSFKSFSQSSVVSLFNMTENYVETMTRNVFAVYI